MGEYANKALGKTKKTLGKLTGNRSLQAKGTIQEYAGKAQGGAKKLGRKVRSASANLRRKAATRPMRKGSKATRAGRQRSYARL